MGCLGVHFAITEQEASQLRSIKDEQERLEFLQTEIEEVYFAEFQNFIAESDKAWDAMHRALSDGQLSWEGGSYPLNHAVLAGEILYTGDEYIMSLKTPEQVLDIIKELELMEREGFRQRYFAIDPRSYSGTLTDEDFDYTWQWFQQVRNVYRLAAASHRYMLFTADQ